MSNNTFDLNRGFVRRLTEWYHDDQIQLFRVLELDAIQHQRRKQDYEAFRPFSKERVKKHIRTLLEVSFWASLMKEEGRHHKFTLVFSSPGEYSLTANEATGYRRFVFREPLPFDAPTLAKLAPALESTEEIGVWPTTSKSGKDRLDELVIWGCAAPLSGHQLLLKAIEPGQIILSLGDYLKARITGLTAEIVDENTVRTLLDFFGSLRPTPHEDFIVQQTRRRDLAKIALSMRDHGHGGTLLVIANDNTKWQDSIDIKLLRFTGQPYGRAKKDLEQRDDALRRMASSFDMSDSRDRSRRSLEAIARLTAVDGATVVTCDLAVLGFGAKIKPITEGRGPETVVLNDSFEGSKLEKKPLAEVFWGTRHKSAAQFVFDQKDAAIAIVASMDGGISVFSRHDEEEVRVIRNVEFLLL